ncbi:formylglycine-generating enzyme family protein [Octadecabacter sp. CECT 8868]|uniref:formylglycine-generating enzyme family protein n=1 Tax=Octadecabacter algicola TaxID=2909342 RepID=UPI001F1B7929|nr:formylglycine-generating enzyme family protein [Octadecabacter algicola]MCF2906395.1 formylglycine-generating enzyme family protein [Octadecabacter algicola]
MFTKKSKLPITCLLAFLLYSDVQQASAQDIFELGEGHNVKTLEMFRECSVCPEMIVLPLGGFRMGAPVGEARFNLMATVDGGLYRAEPGDPAIEADERPLHQVVMDMPIAMGRNEITRGEWMACVIAGGCNGFVPTEYTLRSPLRFESPYYYLTDDHPVVGVSYLDAVSYVQWLNETVGADVYRIPTEAEWEYAARAGTQARFAQGDTINTDQANFNGEATERAYGLGEERLVFRYNPVTVNDLDAANAWGLRHMSGNVTELTSSCYTNSYAGWSTASEWRDKSVGLTCRRATRGGSYLASVEFSRVAQRGRADEDTRNDNGGFRVVRDLQ